MTKPTVSVIIPSYNHAPYIARAIQSVLDQTYTDFELLISDDASTDGSADVIRSFDDERITAFFQEKNLGAVGAIDFLNAQAKGTYIALLNSDDYWAVEKLEKQVAYMEAHPEIGVCFTQGVMVDEEERILTELDVPYANIFMQKNKTQGEWLRYFWESGNALSHMSILARHDIYATEFSLNPALRQLPDFDLWIRIVQKHAIHVIQEPLFYHRRMSGEHTNTSAETTDNSLRGIAEETWIMGRMIQDMPDHLLQEGFSDLFCHKDAQTSLQLQCERFFLMQKHRLGVRLKAVAQTYYFECAHNADFVACMQNEYGYSINNFYTFTGERLLLDGKAAGLVEGEAYLRYREELEAYRTAIEELTHSTSWRLTKPLRFLSGLFKRRK